MKIRFVHQAKKRFMDLLLLADEQEDMIDRYLERGDLFVAFEGKTAVAEGIVTDEGEGVFELKSLAVQPDFQRQGYGKRMVDFLWTHYADRCRVMLVGTGESPLTLPFYERCGFRYSHRIPDFFVTHYNHPIMEAGQQLTDMIYLKKENNGYLPLRQRLTGRISKTNLAAIAHQAGTDGICRQQLLKLVADPDKRVGDNAAWALTLFSAPATKALMPYRKALTDEALRTGSLTRQRLLLTVLERLPDADTFRADLLDFCLNTLLSNSVPHGIRALCIKLAARMCQPLPELRQELRLTLDLLAAETLPPSLRCARKAAFRLIGSPAGDVDH